MREEIERSMKDGPASGRLDQPAATVAVYSIVPAIVLEYSKYNAVGPVFQKPLRIPAASQTAYRKL